MEAMDRDFLSLYFKKTRGNLYGQAGNCEISDHIERMEGQGPLDWADLQPLIGAVEESNPPAVGSACKRPSRWTVFCPLWPSKSSCATGMAILSPP